MRPPSLDLPFSPTEESARLTLGQTVSEHRFYGHLWIWGAVAFLGLILDTSISFREMPGTGIALFWGFFVFLHFRRVIRSGRRRFLLKHAALLDSKEDASDEGVYGLRLRLLKALDGARETLRSSGTETMSTLSRGENQSLAMVAWLADAEPLVQAQRLAQGKRRRVMDLLARPGLPAERPLYESLLALHDENDRRLRRIEGERLERQDTVESFLLAVDSAQMARRSQGDGRDSGDYGEASQRRVDLLEQALEGPVLDGPAARSRQISTLLPLADGSLRDGVAREAASGDAVPGDRGAGAVVRGDRAPGEEARFRQEFGLARELQESILPAVAPQLPGLEVAHLYCPSSELGGDFYDFYALSSDPEDDDAPSDRLLVALGDASGHGLDSSMVSSMAKSALYMQVAARRDLSASMVELNRMMCDTLGRRRMMSLVLLEIEIEEGHLRWTNAGQLYPLLCRGRKVIELAQPGYPLGVRRKQGFAVAKQQILPGDQLVLLTDGFIEATHATDLYGWPRLLETLAQRPCSDARGVIDYLMADLRSHLGDEEAEDDVTLLVLDYRPELPR